ncbi:MAG: FAD:protein FMN transferase, partial [bacterium]|nr:FAD:protein FMN transferase [bacterium]
AARAQLALDRAYLEIDRIEAMISSWRPTSVTSEINRQAGVRAVPVPAELFNLVRRSLKLSELTGGAFDITFAGLGGLWDFKADNPRLPEPAAIRQALEHVGYRKIVLDSAERTIFLNDSGARIGFGAIGKGYAANRAVFVLKENGIESGVVSAGGDLVAFGRKEDGGLWDVGIAHPLHRDHVFARLPLSEQAVVTSGDYESFVTIDGKRYTHILDPRTGVPVDHLRSVTVVCPDGELADALATAVFVMGPVDGLRLINQLNGIEALLVDAEGQLLFSGRLRSQLVFSTDGSQKGER